MSGAPFRKLLIATAVGAAAAAAVRALRGDRAPQFANHPSVDGGPRPVPARPTLEPVPVVPTKATLPAAPVAEPDPEPEPVPEAEAEAEAVSVSASASASVSDHGQPELPLDDEPAAAPLDAAPALSDPTPVATNAPEGAATTVDEPSTWRAPVDGTCPEGFPVKAKLKSGLFHLPGMFAYDRTKPDRCYANAADAEADGLRAAKR